MSSIVLHNYNVKYTIDDALAALKSQLMGLRSIRISIWVTLVNAGRHWNTDTCRL